jgi:hypothetical protein
MASCCSWAENNALSAAAELIPGKGFDEEVVYSMFGL